jgi:hypothetical protein
MISKKLNFVFLVSSKAVQSIVALIILALMGLVGFCLKFDIYSYCQRKKKYVEILFRRRKLYLVF